MSPLNTPWQRKWLDMDVTHPEVQWAADDIDTWKRSFSKRDLKARKHLIISGQVGTGKTHFAERLKRWASRISITLWESGFWPAPPRVEWIEWAQVVFLPYEEFKRWLDGLHDCQLLFVEDLGAEVDRFKNDEPTERFREVLNEFKHRWLFLTTNVMPEQWSKRWDERIQDRLMRDSIAIQLRNTPRFTVSEISG